MIRARFTIVCEDGDYRPITWPIKHPYWCTGSGWIGDKDAVSIVAYGDDEAYFRALWPEITDFDFFEEADQYEFTSRMPKPDWFTQ